LRRFGGARGCENGTHRKHTFLAAGTV
jgi:hypothetical protein